MSGVNQVRARSHNPNRSNIKTDVRTKRPAAHNTNDIYIKLPDKKMLLSIPNNPRRLANPLHGNCRSAGRTRITELIQKRIEGQSAIAKQKKIEEKLRIAEQKRTEQRNKIVERQRVAKQRRIEGRQRIAEQKRIEERARIAEQIRIAEQKRIAKYLKQQEEAKAERLALEKQKKEKLSRPTATSKNDASYSKEIQLRATAAHEREKFSDSVDKATRTSDNGPTSTVHFGHAIGHLVNAKVAEYKADKAKVGRDVSSLLDNDEIWKSETKRSYNRMEQALKKGNPQEINDVFVSNSYQKESLLRARKTRLIGEVVDLTRKAKNIPANNPKKQILLVEASKKEAMAKELEQRADEVRRENQEYRKIYKSKREQLMDQKMPYLPDKENLYNGVGSAFDHAKDVTHVQTGSSKPNQTTQNSPSIAPSDRPKDQVAQHVSKSPNRDGGGREKPNGPEAAPPARDRSNHTPSIGIVMEKGEYGYQPAASKNK